MPNPSSLAERALYSDTLLDYGARAVNAGGQVLRLALRPFNGAPSPNFVTATWHRPKDYAPLPDKDFEQVPGDQNAGLLPRRWLSAVVVAASYEELLAIAADHPDAIASVAYRDTQTGAQLAIGNLPYNYFGTVLPASSHHMGVLMRRGPGDVQLTVGYDLPAEKRLIIPESLTAIQASHDGQFFDVRTVAVVQPCLALV